MQEYLSSDSYLDVHHPDIKQYVERIVDGQSDQRLKICLLYRAVRDDFWYDPYHTIAEMPTFRASRLLQRGRGHCIDKASFLVCCYRAAGVPARIGLAKVKNHIATERLEKILKSNVLTPHGYVEVWTGSRWAKCTPAFNRQLCEKLNVAPLEFDGENDSIFQAYDREGGKFMEYLHDYGSFAQFPYAFILHNFRSHYPHFFDENGNLRSLAHD